MPEQLEIDVSYAARRPWVPRRAQFETWAGAVLFGLGACNLSVRVVGAARSRSLNARYRRKDKPTNVMSFSGAGSGPDGRHYLGELVICAPVVAREAVMQSKSRESHWAHMTVHGVLHLLGFDHERAPGAAIMAAREIQILDQLGFSDPYA
jgi:probable rRNA maturation factor